MYGIHYLLKYMHVTISDVPGYVLAKKCSLYQVACACFGVGDRAFQIFLYLESKFIFLNLKKTY